MTTTSPGPQTRCSPPSRNSILPLSIHTICSFAWLCGSTWTPAPPLGFITEQITNAYVVHEPTSGLGLLATLVFATESNSWTASAHIVESFNGAGTLNPANPLHRALERLGTLLESRKGAAPNGAAKGLPM